MKRAQLDEATRLCGVIDTLKERVGYISTLEPYQITFRDCGTGLSQALSALDEDQRAGVLKLISLHLEENLDRATAQLEAL